MELQVGGCVPKRGLLGTGLKAFRQPRRPTFAWPVALRQRHAGAKGLAPILRSIRAEGALTDPKKFALRKGEMGPRSAPLGDHDRIWDDL